MKTYLINIFISLSSIFFTVLFLEYFLDDYLIDKTPLKFHFALPEAMQVLAQSSKDNRLPSDYMALVGDSYSQGKGDWLLTADPNQNSPYHSAHLIHQYTGQDVISLGRSGASSIKGLVRDPIAKFGFIQRNIDSSIQYPKQILVYFYAGNDLEDNWLQLKNKFAHKYGWAKVNDNEIWDKYFATSINNKKVGPLGHLDTNHGWLLRATKKMLTNNFNQARDKDISLPEQKIHSTVNKALINNHVMPLPDRLQSPAMTLNEQQTQLALNVFSRSLTYMKQFFHDAKITVVYIPSVIESYQLMSKQVSVFHVINEDAGIAQKEGIFTKQQLQSRSAFITRSIEKISQQHHISFIDTRPIILQASKKQYIHGPRDWLHFNQQGYHALTIAIICSQQFTSSVLPEYTAVCTSD